MDANKAIADCQKRRSGRRVYYIIFCRRGENYTQIFFLISMISGHEWNWYPKFNLLELAISCHWHISDRIKWNSSSFVVAKKKNILKLMFGFTCQEAFKKLENHHSCYDTDGEEHPRCLKGRKGNISISFINKVKANSECLSWIWIEVIIGKNSLKSSVGKAKA